MTEISTQSINYLATSNDNGKNVLLIGLKETYRNKPQYQRYLKKEFEKAKDLDNANIVKLLSINDSDTNGLCIEAEWQDSRSLAEWLKEGHSDDEKKRVVRQVANALGYMHSQGIVQGNVNSHNVFITKQGDNVKLLTVHIRYADSLKQPSEDLKYLAPEAKDGTVGLDAKADIYSLGIMLKDMGFMLEYQPVIERCCRFGRNERFEDVDAFLDAMDHRHYTRAASNPEEISEPATPVTTNKKMAIIVAVIVILIGAAVALLVAQGGSDSDNTAAKQPATEQTTTDENAEPSSSDLDSTAKQQPEESVPSDSTGAAYTGDNAFLADLVPQMHTDLDKIFNSGADQATINKKVSTYYKGLRKVLKKRHLTSSQMDAFDQAFAEYVKGKK